MGGLRFKMDRSKTVDMSLTIGECGLVCAGLQNVLDKTVQKQAKLRVKLKDKIRLVRMQKYRQTRTRSLIYSIPETTFKERQTKESLLKQKARQEKKLRQSLISKRQLTTQLKGFQKKTTILSCLKRKFQDQPTAIVYGWLRDSSLERQLETDNISGLPSDGGETPLENLADLF